MNCTTPIIIGVSTLTEEQQYFHGASNTYPPTKFDSNSEDREEPRSDIRPGETHDDQ
jgi:hypothetical protein